MNVIVDKAREYIGISFIHTGRTKEGVDCTGLLCCVFAELGCDVPKFIQYSHGDEIQTLLLFISDYCNEIPFDNLRSGDIIIFRDNRMTNHCGIFCYEKQTFIHAYGHPMIMKVVESNYDINWFHRTYKCFRYKEML